MSKRRAWAATGRCRRLAEPHRPEHPAADDGAGLAQHGMGDPQCRRPLLHRAGRPTSDAGMGHHGVGRRELHHLRRMVGLHVSRAPRWCSRCSPSTCWATGCAICSIQGSACDGAARHRQSVGRVPHPPRSGAGAGRCNACRSRKGEIVGVVGESGSGKSVTAYAVMGLIDEAAAYHQGPHQDGRHRSSGRSAGSDDANCAGAKWR